MDRIKVRLIMADAQAALAEIAKKHGMSASDVRASFGDLNCNLRIEFTEIGEGGVVIDREAQELKKYAELYGLPKDAYGMEFTDGGRKYRLVGLAARRSKFPVIAEREDGKKFKFPVDRVKALLGIQKR